MSERFNYLVLDDKEDPFTPSKEQDEIVNKLSMAFVKKRQENEYVLVPGNPQGLSSELVTNVPNVDTVIYTFQFPVGMQGVFNPDIVNSIFFTARDKDNNFINGIVSVRIIDAMRGILNTIFREESIIFNLTNSARYRPSLFRWNTTFVAEVGDQLQLLFNSRSVISPQFTELSLRLIMIRQQNIINMGIGNINTRDIGR